MKVSELIKTLEDMKTAYGDLDITIHIDSDEGKILGSEEIFLGYDQYEDCEKIDIRSFIY